MDFLRVLLLSPPTAADSSEPLLNLASLAATLRSFGHQVKIIDATAPFNKKSAEEIENEIKGFQPHFIGITLTITYIPQSYEFIKKLRLLGIPIIAGGPHPNACPQEVLKNGVDIVCIGEGEKTIVEIAEYIMGKRDLSSVNGICYRSKDGKFVISCPRTLIEDLDTLSFPSFVDFPIHNYTGNDDPESNPIFWSVFSSRGCPFDCIFCSSHNVFGRTMRLRSAENVVREIKELVERFKIKTIAFQDDEILCKKDRFLEFCKTISNLKLYLKMSIRTRINSIDPEILAYAKRAGITRISFGIESWDDETLLKINKKYDVRAIHRHFGYLSEAQPLYVSFNNIIGFPWETRKHYQNTIREIKKIPLNVKFFTAALTPIPFPKTKLYEDYHEKFNFTEWWLDPNKHAKVEYVKNTVPFFMKFMESFHTLYSKNMFWNYTNQQLRDISWFSWTLFGVFLKRSSNLFEYILLMFLCRFSHWLWWKNKKWEYSIFSRIGRMRFFNNLQQKLTFTNKY